MDAALVPELRRRERILNPRKLAAAYALAVTTHDVSGHTMLARNGPDSLFRLLQRILPQVPMYSLLLASKQKSKKSLGFARYLKTRIMDGDEGCKARYRIRSSIRCCRKRAVSPVLGSGNAAYQGRSAEL